MVQYFPVITGSLTVSGSIIATGAISMSGSIASSSYATNTSYLNNSGSGEFVPTGSFNAFSSSILTYTGSVNSQLSALQTTSGSNITRLNSIEAQTGSYATTGSNIFVGNQTITGSVLQSGSLSVNGCIVSSGQIVAQTINVQQVTSSVVYSCGSNIFGCAVTDTQQMTGSLRVSGSNALFNVGCVGIGTTSPSQKLHICGTGGSLTFGVDQANTSIIRGNVTANFDLNNEGGGCIRLYGSEVQFRTNLTDPAVAIKNSGITCFACTICAPIAYIGSCLLINQTSSLLDITSARIEMSGIGSTFPTSQASYNVFANHGTNPTWVGYLTFFKSRGTTQGSVTAVASGDRLGMVRFNGADGTEQIRAAEIYSEVDAAVSKCCVPGRIIFATADSNLNGPVERFRITSTGIACFAGQVCVPNLRVQSAFANLTLCGSNTTSPHVGGTFSIDTNQDGNGRTIIGNSAVNRAMFLEANGAITFNCLFTSAGPAVFNTCVGIGTSTPCGRLHLTGIYNGAQNTLNLENNWPNTFETSLINFWAYYNNTNPQAVIEAGQDNSATNAGTIMLKTMLAGSTPVTRMKIFPSGLTCFQNTVCTPSGIRFGGGNCVLNNYDEGSWTIVATGSSSGSGNVGTGTYTRVGRLVTATFLINNQTFPSYSGTLRLSLPFAVGAGIGGNLSFNTGGVYFYPYSAWGAGVTNFTYLQAVALNSTSYVSLAISCVNGDLQTTIANTNSSTSGAAGLYLRFTITYEV